MKKPFCPLLGKPCIESKCAWFTKIQGNNPNTGHPIEENQCAVNFLPFLLIENSQQQRSTAAAVESFRNETINQNTTLTQVLVHAVNQGVTSRMIEEAQVQVLPSNP